MIQAYWARVPQACEILNCSPGTLYKRLKSGEIRSAKDGRVRKVDMRSIGEYMQHKLDTDPWASQGGGQGVGQAEE